MTDFDRTDARLLLALCERPRATGVELANILGMSRNTVQARLTRWEEKDTLTPIDHRVRPRSLGYALQAFVTTR
jgi:DNA-binding Lrp family transcriptional regulator